MKLHAFDFPDYTSQDGAVTLAQRIKDHWIREGYRGIHTDITEIRLGKDLFGFGVRSNIGPDGYPPREAMQ